MQNQLDKIDVLHHAERIAENVNAQMSRKAKTR
jgi:hypothetical protein